MPGPYTSPCRGEACLALALAVTAPVLAEVEAESNAAATRAPESGT